jgi:tRNA uridine 5-carbamoylmethylation protein Kti12
MEKNVTEQMPSEQEVYEHMSDPQRVMSHVRFEQLSSPELAGKKIVYIMRGVPGSGKSTAAKEIAHPDGAIHSTDTKFLDEKNVYRFDGSMLEAYHKKNFEEFCESLKGGKPIVVLDNTNIKEWHYKSETKNYVKAAKENGYIVRIVEMPFPKPEDAEKWNTHGVSKEIIKRLIKQFEPETTEKKVPNMPID